MTSTGLSSWIYTSFRRTKRRFQGFQRNDGANGLSSAKSALLPDITAANSPSPRDSLDVDEDVDDIGIANKGETAGSRPNSVVDAVSGGVGNGGASPAHSATASSAIKYDAMMESEPSSPMTPPPQTTNNDNNNTANSSPPSSSPKSPFRKRSSKPFLSLRKKKKSESASPKADKKATSPWGSEEAKSVSAASTKDQQPPSTPTKVSTEGLDDGEVEMLRQEVTALKMELRKSEENYKRLGQREKILQDRLAAQALHVLEKSGKFENINSAQLRPSQIVTMFQELYSQGRVDAIDALDELEELEDFDDLKTKIVYSVIVLSFRSAKRAVDNLNVLVKDSLQLPDTSAFVGEDIDGQLGLLDGGNILSNSLEINDPRHTSGTMRHFRWASLAKGVEDAMADWLRKTAMAFDLASCLEEVEEQLHATLFDFPSLRNCAPLRDFIKTAIRVSWCCVVQNPPFVLEYQQSEFKAESHQRFVTADPDNEKISSYVWPGLYDDENGSCLVRGVVIT